MKKILYQGAEAIITLEGGNVVKERLSKKYRISFLDKKIIKQRTKRESKILEKLHNIINVPKVVETSENHIVMEYIDGEKISENLDKFDLKKQERIMELIGISLAKLHDFNIVHGDLTTSNMILKDDKVFFVDFGLSFYSLKIEDKAVDIHLLKQALESKHFKKWKELFNCFLRGYKKSKDFDEIVKRLEKVELRGRYKQH